MSEQANGKNYRNGDPYRSDHEIPSWPARDLERSTAFFVDLIGCEIVRASSTDVVLHCPNNTPLRLVLDRGNLHPIMILTVSGVRAIYDRMVRNEMTIFEPYQEDAKGRAEFMVLDPRECHVGFVGKA